MVTRQYIIIRYSKYINGFRIDVPGGIRAIIIQRRDLKPLWGVHIGYYNNRAGAARRLNDYTTSVLGKK